MQESARLPHHERPESFVEGLAARLSRHLLWDSLMICLPWVGALVFAAAMFFWRAWLSPMRAIFIALFCLGFTSLVVWWRLHRRIPSLSAVARLADGKAQAQDRFLTLTTVDRANQPPFLLKRLQQQASAYRERIDLKRDFPYRFKPSAYRSIGASLVGMALLYFLLPPVQFAPQPMALSQQLREMARELAKKPDLGALSKEMESLAAVLEDPKRSAEEKQALIQKLQQKIAEQQKNEKQKDNRDLLGQAASSISGTQQQRSSSGNEHGKEQKKGGGGLQTNAQQKGQGESKPSQGGSGDGQSESTAQLSTEMEQGKSTNAKPKGPGQDKNSQGDAQNKSLDPNRPSKGSQERAGETRGGSKEGAGREQRAEEAPPLGGRPAERFYRPGEGQDGLKGAGYVTVQLPEDIVADAKGETRGVKGLKGDRRKVQVPVSNVPLPAHVPNAPSEKQPLPIEYRGIIR